MADEKAVAPVPTPEAPPKTEADLMTEKLDAIKAKVKEVGVQPLKELASTYAHRGMSLLDAMLAALDEKPKK